MDAMSTCKEEATRWVHRYAAGGALLAALPLPISTTSALAALETYMMRVIGDVYGDAPSGTATAVAGSSFAIGGQGLKVLAMRAGGFIPLLGIPVRMVIAGATIEALGHAIIHHYERKHPGKGWGA
jgi:uncharacterized protein (DUF697 family)